MSLFPAENLKDLLHDLQLIHASRIGFDQQRQRTDGAFIKVANEAYAILLHMDNPNTAPAGRRHNADFTCCHWDGVNYTFSLKQSLVVAKLWEAMDDGLPDVQLASLLEEADSRSSRLRSLFARHAAWGIMIIRSTHGFYRLASPATPLRSAA